jgi:hypothetical protein
MKSMAYSLIGFIFIFYIPWFGSVELLGIQIRVRVAVCHAHVLLDAHHFIQLLRFAVYRV